MLMILLLSVIRYLICELKFDLGDTVDWSKKWLLDFNDGKTNNTGSIHVKMDRCVFEVKPFFKMLWLTFSSKLDLGTYIISITKTVSKKIGVLICSMKFLSPEIVLYL